MGARSNPHALADTISSYNTSECGRSAGVLDSLRAAETACVHLCLQIWATVDTTPRYRRKSGTLCAYTRACSLQAET